jgi:hypothetical protein
MKIADYGKAITSYIESPTQDEKELLKLRAQEANRTFLADGTIPPKKPKQLKDLFNSIDTAVLSVSSNTIAPEFILPDLEKKTQEYIKEGLISGEDARKFAIERKDYWDKWISENPGGTAPDFEFDNEGKSRILSQEEIIERINQSDGGRIGFSEGSEDRYNKVRPIVNRDYNRGAKDTDTHKIVFKKSKNQTLPAEFEGTQFYSSEIEANKALEAKQKFIVESKESKKKPPIPEKKDKFLVKVGSPKKVNNVIEQNFIEVIGSRNRPETYKKTGVKKTLYRAQINSGDKTIFSTDFGSKADAMEAVQDYRKTNPIKNAPPDLTTLNEQKKKKYLDKKERSGKISERGGVETFETGDKVIHKGHAQNIDNPDVKIKPSNIIYTPWKINQSMSGSEGEGSGRYTDLDYKIDAAEEKIREIKNNKNLSESEKKKLLQIEDNKLMKYVALSDGYKTVTLSNNKAYGEIFQKGKSMDMLDIFPDMTEKEAKKFVNKYFNDGGKLKDKWNIDPNKISDADKEGIKKSYIFLENIKNAKINAKSAIADVDKEFKKFGITLTGDQANKAKTFLRSAFNKGQNIFKFLPNKFVRKGGGTVAAAIDYGLFHHVFGVPNTEALISAAGWLKGLDKSPLQKTIQSTSAIAGMQEQAPETFRELVGFPGPIKEDDFEMTEKLKEADKFMNLEKPTFGKYNDQIKNIKLP